MSCTGRLAVFCTYLEQTGPSASARASAREHNTCTAKRRSAGPTHTARVQPREQTLDIGVLPLCCGSLVSNQLNRTLLLLRHQQKQGGREGGRKEGRKGGKERGREGERERGIDGEGGRERERAREMIGVTRSSMQRLFCGSFASFLTAATSADVRQGGISPSLALSRAHESVSILSLSLSLSLSERERERAREERARAR